MTRRNKTRSSKLSSDATKIKQLNEQVKTLKLSNKKKNKPFSSTGAIIGKSVGGMFGNATIGSNIGKWLGSGIGSIFGSGDYTMVGENPAYNVLTNGKQIPHFSTTHATNVVCNREYLGDILGTTSFNNTAYPLNPGINTTFPWLSTIAQNYQEYRFHGLVYEFRPLITDFVTNGAPGVIVMATNYNADAAAYTSKQQMENSEFAVSVKPTTALMHGVECDLSQTILPQRFVRTGAVPAAQDMRLYDYGNFQLATQSNPVQDLGELWVSYCVEFFKPILPSSIGGDILTGHVVRSNAAGAAPLGLGTAVSVGSLALSVNATSISWISQPSATYQITIIWQGTNAVVTFPSATLTNASYQQFLCSPAGADKVTYASAPENGINAHTYTVTYIITCTAINTATISINYVTTAILPTVAFVDILVTQLDSTVNA
uniref:Capsid protein n=2 Tax=Riboviria sp. TaxID=2585031 RepID=A0A514D8C0_9VIRU|nr:MAG: hypothetical protein H1Bulk30435_000001 [Riboviria sp.]